MDGDTVKVSVSVKYLDQKTKAAQISQFDLKLQKTGGNWKIVGYILNKPITRNLRFLNYWLYLIENYLNII